MTNNSILCVSRGYEFTAGSLFLLAYGSAKSQEILKNLNKAIEKNLKRDSLLEKTEVFNQYLLIYWKTGTPLVLKLYIYFITLWDDPMQDDSVTVIKNFELFNRQHWLKLARIALIVMIVGGEKDTFFVTFLYCDKCLGEQTSVVAL